jgi:alpha-tubulin suppressor-like RCC1 family protein
MSGSARNAVVSLVAFFGLAHGCGGTTYVDGTDAAGTAMGVGGSGNAVGTGNLGTGGGIVQGGGASGSGNAAGTSKGGSGGQTGPKLVAKAITAGGSSTCALIADGTIQCWGLNGDGQLGNGATDPCDVSSKCSKIPRAVLGIANAVSVSTGEYHTCAVLADSTVRCWGSNKTGQLGNGTTTSSATPTTVPGITNAVAVAVGGASRDIMISGIGAGQSCALLADGTVRCWGANDSWALGSDTTEKCGDHPCSTSPITVPGIPTASALFAGRGSNCVVSGGGAVTCWGAVLEAGRVPAAVPGIAGAIAVGTTDRGACAVLADGTLQCWGMNFNGELGNGACVDSSTPVAVLGITNAVAVARGGGHNCAVLSDGTARCWGWDYYGQLGGSGSSTSCPDVLGSSSSTPLTVDGVSNAVTVAAGDYHTCVLLKSGSVACFGYNSYGQLGLPKVTGSSAVTPQGF